MPKSVFSPAYQAAIGLLIELRKERGVSQEELARRLGKKQPFISLVERLERRLDVVEFYVFVRAIGADPATALGELARRMPDEIEI